MIKLVLAVLTLGLALAGCTASPQAGTPGLASGTTTSVPPTSQNPPNPVSPNPTSPNPASTTGQPPSPASSRCTAAMLAGTVQVGDAAAGNRYAKLVVTNTGTTPCTLYGYGGLQLIAADGSPLPTSTGRDEPPGPSLVTVAPGASATKNLHWGVIPSGNEPGDAPCQPQPHGVRVIPPDDTEPFTVAWSFGPVCAAGTIHDSAYYK
jgi:uncharacterized protein DUF4232